MMPANNTKNAKQADDSTGSPALAGVQVQKPILFFDGVCGLCNQTVNFLLDKDRRRILLFAPLQGETAQTLLDENCRDLKSLVYWDDDEVSRKSTAIVRVLWRIGGIWKIAAALLWVIPYPLRDFGYSVVARYRYAIFGKHETCRMPTPEERSRFLP